jgi:hypothetical protein
MKTLLLLTIIALAGLALAQPPDTLWTRVVSLPPNWTSSWATVAVSGFNGGYIVAGGVSRPMYPWPEQSGWVAALDSEGALLWTSVRTELFVASSVDKTSTGDILLIGASWQVTCLHDDGQLSWTRYCPPPGEIIEGKANAVRAMDDGGCVLVGTNWVSYLPYSAIVRLNAVGETLWTCYLADTSDVVSIMPLPNSRFLVGGNTRLGTSVNDDRAFIACVDSLGNAIWKVLFSGGG